MEKGPDQTGIVGRYFGRCREYGLGWGAGVGFSQVSSSGFCVLAPSSLFPMPLLLLSERRPPLALLVAVRIKAACENILTYAD